MMKLKTKYNSISQFYDDNFDINGKYYLHLLYFSEFTESWVQFSNLIQLYSCTLPIGWNITFTILLIIESSHRTKFMFHKLWGEKTDIHFDERNFQVILDIAIDLFFLIIPLVILWFGYRMSMSVGEVLQIVIVPSISLLSKLPTVIGQIVNNHVNEEIASGQAQTSLKMNRRRKSLFGLSVNEEVVKMQNKYFSRYMKVAVFLISFLYSIGLVITMVGQLVNLSSIETCENIFDNTNLWKQGCVIKIPYCKRAFAPKCNCASLHIENDYSINSLPLKVTTEMDGLRKVFIKNTNLTALPNEMENLKEMVDFEIVFNQLQEFNVNVLKWPRLSRLSLEFNNITKCDENMWRHPELVLLDLKSNPGLPMPLDITKINLPNLIYLHMGNNSVQIPIELSSDQLPSILFLYFEGNIMEMLPTKMSSFKETIDSFSVARCGLKSLNGLETLEQLYYLDARNNSISTISDNLKNLIKKARISVGVIPSPAVHAISSFDFVHVALDF
eukprot:g10160.t1